MQSFGISFFCEDDDDDDDDWQLKEGYASPKVWESLETW